MTTAPRSATAAPGRPWAVFASMLFVVLVLLAAGWGQRALVQRIDVAMATPTRPQQPLSALPRALGDWRGTDVELDPDVFRVGWFDDDYCNRVYTNTRTGANVAAFIGYVGHTRAQFGHRPDVCYITHGWDQIGAEKLELHDVHGNAIPCLVYEFHKPNSFEPPLTVVATYMINGRFFSDPADLTRWHTRNPGLLGERPAYLTRIQLSMSGRSEFQVEQMSDLLTQLTGPTADLMPYWEPKE